jgi:hypothetical protein
MELSLDKQQIYSGTEETQENKKEEMRAYDTLIVTVQL